MSETMAVTPPALLSREEKIAQVCHEANRAYCETIGDLSQQPWDISPGWQRDSAIEGVTKHLYGEITSPEQSHESWLKHKVDDGWVYGEHKDAVLKTHPCCVPYGDLPPLQRRKDHLFAAIVGALR